MVRRSRAAGVVVLIVLVVLLSGFFRTQILHYRQYAPATARFPARIRTGRTRPRLCLMLDGRVVLRRPRGACRELPPQREGPPVACRRCGRADRAGRAAERFLPPAAPALPPVRR